MSDDTLLVEVKDGIATVTINRPAQRNALTRAMWRRLPEIFEGLENGNEVRVILIRGAGDKAFASGQDIREFREFKSPEQIMSHSDLVEDAWVRICQIRLPIIAMVHGFAMGGAFGLMATCDLRYASEDAVLAIPAGRLGVVYPELLTRRIMDLIGPANTKEILMTARRYTAEEAYQMGFINRVLPKEELEGYTLDIARKIAENAPLSVIHSKEMINLIQARTLKGEARERAQAIRQLGFSSEDFKEGVTAFLEKRPPVFKGI